METMDLLQKIDCLLHKVEGLLRGNSTAGVVIELRKDCFEFLELMSKDNIEDFSKQLEPLVKKEALKSVIRLHNKCRNLTQTAALQELKNLIKMICSIIMIITGEQKNKVLAVAVKILCKAGQEMMTTDLPKEIILRCLVTAVATWQEACELMIQRELPALEVQDVTAAVFWAYCSKGCVIYEMGKGLGLARAEFAAAFAMVQSLPLDLKVAFATNILQFCRNAIKGPDGSDTNMVALLEMGLNCIESAMLEQDTLHEEADNDQDGVESLISRKKPVQEIRFQILLSLIFVHIQLRCSEKAFHCVKMVETSTYFTQDSVVTWGLPILNFAKLIIQLLEGSFTDAETTLSYLLLQQHAPEQLVLEAVRRYCIELQTKGSGASDSLFFKAWRFYQQAIEKYGESLRNEIEALQTLVGFFLDPTDTDSEAYFSVLEFSKKIAAKFCLSSGEESNDNIQNLRGVLSDRIRWYRHAQQWNAVHQWGEILLSLIKDQCGETDREISLTLIMVECMIHTNRVDSAYEIASELHQHSNSMRTMIMLFKAFLHSHRPITDCITICTPGLDLTNGKNADMLQRFLICARLATQSVEVTKERRDGTISLLLSHWLNLCAKSKAWNDQNVDRDFHGSCTVELPEYDSYQVSFLAVICEKLNRFLAEILYCEEFATDNIAVSPASAPAKKSFASETKCMELSLPHEHGKSQNQSPFSIIGYPDCIAGGIVDVNRKYKIRCSCSEFQNHFVQVAEFASQVITDVVSDNVNVNKLGSNDEIAWLCSVIWNLALLIDSTGTSFAEFDPFADKYLLVARLMECCADLLKATQSRDETNPDVSRALIIATHARIDACEDLGENSINVCVECNPTLIEINNAQNGSIDRIPQKKLWEVTISDNDVSTGSKEGILAANLSFALGNVMKAKSTAQLDGDITAFRRGREEPIEHAKLIKLELIILCMMGDGMRCASFLHSHQVDIVLLSPKELKLMAEIARASDGISSDVVYELLCFALQANSRYQSQGTNDQSAEDVLGSIYQQLILMSNTRQQALGKVEEFEQLVRSSADGTFHTCNIDKIATTAYNYGVILVDLDQPHTAEKLVGKAISLVKFGSVTLKEWLPRMQETYCHILAAKGKSVAKATSSVQEMIGRGMMYSPDINIESDLTKLDRQASHVIGDEPLAKKRRADRDALLDVDTLT